MTSKTMLVFPTVAALSAFVTCYASPPRAEPDARDTTSDARGKASTEDGSAGNAHEIDGQEWPLLAKGVWQLNSTVASGDQKAKSSTQRAEACTDPVWLFATYWGTGTVEREGCQFSSWQLSPTRYRLETICMVRHVGMARMNGTVAVENRNGFRMEAEWIEGKKA